MKLRLTVGISLAADQSFNLAWLTARASEEKNSSVFLTSSVLLLAVAVISEETSSRTTLRPLSSNNVD